MKVTILNGSPRKNGATGTLLKAVGERLSALGCDTVERIDVAERDIRPCLGCLRCYRDGGCPLRDDAEAINGHIAASDGLIIGSPTYVSGVSGALKNYIDRGHIVLEQAYRNKYTMSVVTYAITGGGQVARFLKNMSRYAGGTPSGSFLLKLAPDGHPFDAPKTAASLRRKADAFYEAIARGKRKSPLDAFLHRAATRHVIGPTVLRSPERYAAVIENYQ